MKRQTQSSYSISKYSGGPNAKMLNQHSNIGQLGNGFSSLEIQQKVEKIPTTFVFDRRIPPSDYKNYISIDDIYNENFEYARKLFEDPSRAFAVADYSSDQKIPRRLAQVNYKSFTSQEKKRDKKVNFTNQQNQMNSTVGGGGFKLNKNESSKMQQQQQAIPSPMLPKTNQPSIQFKNQLINATSLQSPQQSPHKQMNEDVQFFRDLSPTRQQSAVPDYIHESSKADNQIDQSQLQKSILVSQNQIHTTSQQRIPSANQTAIQGQSMMEQKKTTNQQSQILQKKNSFPVISGSNNVIPLAAAKSTAGLVHQPQINNLTSTQSMKNMPSEKKANEDRVQGLIAQTREKVKKLQSYAEKLKRRVLQNDYGQNYKRSQKTIKKSQLVKEYIFNEDDFNKMLAQEEEEDKKNQANKKEKLKGFVDRQDAFALNENTKMIPNSYQSQIIEQYVSKKEYQKQKSAYQYQDEDDESDKSKDDLKQETSGLFQKSDQKMFKSSKHNFHKKMVLKKRDFDQKAVVQEAEQEYEKVITKLTKNQKHWNQLSILPEKTNQLRAHSLLFARSGKILRNIGDKYGDIDLFVPPQPQKLQIKNQYDLLNHLQALLTKPDVSGDFKLHKQVQVHKNRIKNMRQNDVGITNISNISIEV
ncbi:hypothetical protein TTHERM_00409100 (macronuclear) [Tetrahymena thermophila SB210]|uniref:Uncharacterized protein n=1 Tax=Tetrahymena thermophila (strain SB210) TaxID=312017 RepID=I7MKX4_TETTS|nr:hypothetical protein TTHERM_00409100 [Tetrahymena thermophila SB210]EAS00557.3 hypothetical protein TTHERM_00409100 [Tetrahymena thermophila SB210]|eukprot:XP_001020802.3 hypothetical protein TTHERM_00409100 [Tetrahymena thermophila SB210]